MFANTGQEFALTKPVWDIASKRIVSSINNKPFIIHLEQKHFSIEWLETILGIPKAWYTNTDSILFVDKSSYSDELVKLSLKNYQVAPLNIQLQRKKVFLDNNDRILFFINGQVKAHQSGELLLVNEHRVSFVYPTREGFYYRYEQKKKARIKFYDYLLGTQELSIEFDIFCLQHCKQITTIIGDTILLNEKRNAADILRLNIRGS